MIAAVLQPAIEILAVALLWKMASWALADIVMERVGVPFLDCPWRSRTGVAPAEAAEELARPEPSGS
jgi:hypothetical protein